MKRRKIESAVWFDPGRSFKVYSNIQNMFLFTVQGPTVDLLLGFDRK